jgi:adenylate cyclase
MMKHLFKPSIAKKILIISILTSIIPLSFVSYTNINKAESELKSSLNEKFYLVSNNVQNQVDIIISSQWISDLDAVVYALDVNQQMDANSIRSVIKTVLNKNNDLLLMHINSESFSSPQSYFKIDEIEALRVIDSATVKLFVESIPRSSTFNNKITFGLPIVLNHGEKILLPVDIPFPWGLNETGVVRGVFDLTNAFGTLFNEQHTGQSEVYLLSSEGKILFKNELAELKTNTSFSYPLYEKIEKLQIGASRAFQLESFDYKEKTYLGNFVFLNHLNWALVIVDKHENAYAVLNAMLSGMMLWIFIAFLLTIVFALLFSKSFIKNIKHLIEASKNIGQGKLDFKIDVTSNDELKELANSLEEMALGLKEREKMLRFISQSTASMIANKESIFGSERKELTVLFSDIRGFTSYSESREPEEVISMLNTFLSLQTKCVHDFGGEVDKFIGDEIFAIFFGEKHEERAALAALKMQEHVKIAREASGEAIHIGIGIHCGETVMGTVGVDERMDHTVLGNTVNIGARLCSSAKKDTVIVSEVLKNKLPNRIKTEKDSMLELKGITNAMQVFKLISTTEI